jgi:hypothetical protein
MLVFDRFMRALQPSKEDLRTLLGASFLSKTTSSTVGLNETLTHRMDETVELLTDVKPLSFRDIVVLNPEDNVDNDLEGSSISAYGSKRSSSSFCAVRAAFLKKGKHPRAIQRN